MLIPCPHCGLRDLAEFAYGGDATKRRPDPANARPEDWNDYVFHRDNPRGRHVEYWHHAQGCRLWLKVTRDTVTHKIAGAETVGPWASTDSGKGAGVA
jgi:heterotetrameric sarcosine oxidase delta subunit